MHTKEVTARFVAILLVSTASCAGAFAPILPAHRSGGKSACALGNVAQIVGPLDSTHLRARSSARSSPSMSAPAAHTATLSWIQIDSVLGPEPAAPPPMLTLYRDNNGWCPFCERVWVALMAKGIPFEERTLSLQKKPDWYLEKVPTGLVPAIEFCDSNEVVWESKDILLRLEDDSRFSSFKSLLPAAETDRATMLLNETDQMTKSIAGVLYGSNLTSQELAVKIHGFEESMDKMNTLLSESKSAFFLGSGFSVVDCMLVPVLERLAVQLPLKTGIVLRDAARWPAVEAWFVGMETEVIPYRERVKGDTYSWSAAFVTILEMFQSTQGVGGNDPIANAKQAAAHELEAQLSASPSTFDKSTRLAAVRKLATNYAAIIQDATSEAKSQKSLSRLAAADSSQVDMALRRAASILLSEQDTVFPQEGVTAGEAEAARLIASRLCVPRDMGAPAAGALRAGLGSVALAAAS